LGEEAPVRTFALLLLAGLLAACGSPSPGNDGGNNDACDGPALTPPNLIQDHGFECGGATQPQWSAIYGTLDFPQGTAHSGSYHARITAGADGKARFAYQPNVAVDAGTATFCARAWMKGTAPYMRLRLITDFGANIINNDFNSPVTADWSQVPPSVKLSAPNMNANRVLLVFETQSNRSDGANSMPGQTLEIDDVDVWQSSSSACSER
jgi:hypothetical protein